MEIRAHFDDFWEGLNMEDNVWIWILRKKHNVVLDAHNPNLVFTMDQRNYPDAFTVYYSNEPYFPSCDAVDDKYDYSMSNFFIDKENYVRFPSCYMYIYELIKDLSFFLKEGREIPEKTEFCSLVAGQLHGKRGQFFNRLNRYKKVKTNAGQHNDFSIPFDSSGFSSSRPKIDFIKKYKFNIAFENNFRGEYPSFPGATTEDGCLQDMNGLISEKIIEPFISGTIPIYWGSKMIGDEFNSNTFLNYYDFDSEDDLIERIIELDNDDDLYASYFSEAIANIQNNVLCESHMTNLFDDLVAQL